MTIAIFSNFFNHHQKPLADELYKALGEDFTFVATEPMPDSFKKSGYSTFENTPYVLHAYENEKTKHRAVELSLTSDAVIHGAAPLLYIKERLALNKLTFRYAERMFKKSALQKFNPRTLWNQYKKHTVFKHKDCHMLCASAYTANDLHWIGAYPNKMYKWGYFTKTPNIDIESVLEEKRNSVFTILFVARLIDWKHPEMVILLAEELKKMGCSFEVKIVGSGDMKEELSNMIDRSDLGNCVKLLGNIENEQVLELMRTSHAFFFSSDRNEGWGAVANEAMANGCTLVASHEIGAVPYLIIPYKTGMVFQSKNLKQATAIMRKLIEDRELNSSLARNAFLSIRETWSPKNAATNLLGLSQNLLASKQNNIKTGPCSPAKPTKTNWYKTLVK
ncbi:glycosyltransferase family 4 protein [Flagellimonas marina]|jgi:glycosyltransferase involved in cell wall biosynthesis|uniref:Glycosyltransferase family 4 protein n=1 Tax=Flagellimonas marina TaxID=1775168 RepID=A0ABV8PJY0_9FLAO